MIIDIQLNSNEIKQEQEQKEKQKKEQRTLYCLNELHDYIYIEKLHGNVI